MNYKMSSDVPGRVTKSILVHFTDEFLLESTTHKLDITESSAHDFVERDDYTTSSRDISL